MKEKADYIRLDKKDLQELSKPTVWPWLIDALMDWAIIIAAMALVYFMPNILTFLVAVLLIGNRQHALIILGHDGAHFTLTRKRALNDFLTNFFSMWPVGITVSGYRLLHYRHHKHTGQSEDPELAHKRSRSPQWNLPVNLPTIIKYAVMDIFGCSIPDYYIIVTYSKPNYKTDYIPLALWHLAFVSALVLTGYWLGAILWYSSLLLTFMMFFRLRLWLEHQGTPGTHRLRLNFWQGALLAPHNSWYHWEHHHWPSVPYHRLPRLRELFKNIPVLTLKELLKNFKNAPSMTSGEVLSVLN